MRKRGSPALKRFLIKNYTQQDCRQTTIIAHSMGCRLVLDCLTRLATDRNAPILKPKNVILWSAAVDDDEINRDEAYYIGSKLPTRLWVMHSRRDDVLRKAFPFGDFETALGFSGPDRSEGSVGANVRVVNCTSFIDEHSAWWKSQKAMNMAKRIVETGGL